MRRLVHRAEDGPCGHMRAMLDLAADGRAKGLRAWYARAHASGCPGCGRYLASLGEMIDRLRNPEEPADEEAIGRLMRRLDETP